MAFNLITNLTLLYFLNKAHVNAGNKYRRTVSGMGMGTSEKTGAALHRAFKEIKK